MNQVTPSQVPVAIGDLQGCHDAFSRLLEKLHLPPSTPIWLTGDLVNRGPASLDTLRAVIALGNQATTILGNHDLHLLAIAAGVHAPKKGDTLGPILTAPDFPDLIDWLRRQPLAHLDNGFLMVHAGVLPEWTVEDVAAGIDAIRDDTAPLVFPPVPDGHTDHIRYSFGAGERHG